MEGELQSSGDESLRSVTLEQRESKLRRTLLSSENVKMRLREREQDEMDRLEEEAELRMELRRAEEKHKEQVRMQQEEQAQRLKDLQAQQRNEKKRKLPNAPQVTNTKSAKIADDHASPHTFTIGSAPLPQSVQTSSTVLQNTATMATNTTPQATFASKIPSDSAALFATPIRWDLVDQHGLLEKKIRPWVVKKIVEYLEVEEPTMIQFICTHIKEHKPAKELIAQLQPVLDEETEVFVITLWRMLLMESLKMEAGQF